MQTYYSKNKELSKKKSREYYWRNREASLKRSVDYYNLNKDKIYEVKKKYRENSDYFQKQRAKRFGIYNFSQEDYRLLFGKQNGKCAICNSESKIRLSVDHNHTTGKVRGLLCSHCNLALGYLKDSIDRLKSAISYLEK